MVHALNRTDAPLGHPKASILAGIGAFCVSAHPPLLNRVALDSRAPARRLYDTGDSAVYRPAGSESLNRYSWNFQPTDMRVRSRIAPT